ncbi:hypothetical protein V8J88_08415 [Massilia sp. W12]|uniref:hypothetical protein n=1 Tax=Massilia sp. W12 TaxID=3126507 RepID=UPI0030D1E198
MQSIRAIFFSDAANIKSRITIYLTYYLSLEFTRYFISASAAANPYIAMWGAIFSAVTLIIILDLLYGDSKVGKDINTLISYIAVAHLLYLPFYYHGYQVAIYHNTAVKIINALIIFRLFYLGDRTLFSAIAFIEKTKLIIPNKKRPFSNYVNGLTVTLFIVCAIPFFTLIYIINTDKMRITGIAVVLLVFFIAIEFSNRKRSDDAIDSVVSKSQESDLDAVAQSRDLFKYLTKSLGIALILSILF